MSKSEPKRVIHAPLFLWPPNRVNTSIPTLRLDKHDWRGMQRVYIFRYDGKVRTMARRIVATQAHPRMYYRWEVYEFAEQEWSAVGSGDRIRSIRWMEGQYST